MADDVEPVPKRPTAFVVRSRFQPCLRLHYHAIKALILAERLEFRAGPEAAAREGAVVVLIVIRDYAHLKEDPDSLIPRGGIRHWHHFNPLAASETVRQLEMALWSYFEEDQDWDAEDDRRFVAKVLQHSVFPIQVPGNIDFVLGALAKLSTSHDEREYQFFFDNFQMFRLGTVKPGRYRPCWYFPVFDKEDREHAQSIAIRLRNELKINMLNLPALYKAEKESNWIILGEFEKREDERYDVMFNMHPLGPYGVHVIDTIKRKFLFEPAAPDEIDRIKPARLERLKGLFLSDSVRAYFEQDIESFVWADDSVTALLDALIRSELSVPDEPVDEIVSSVVAIFGGHGGGTPAKKVVIPLPAAGRLTEYLNACQRIHQALDGLGPEGDESDDDNIAIISLFDRISSSFDNGLSPNVFDRCCDKEVALREIALLEDVATRVGELKVAANCSHVCQIVRQLSRDQRRELAELSRAWPDED